MLAVRGGRKRCPVSKGRGGRPRSQLRMASAWTADDDAAMARLLAPVLGEAAVYAREADKLIPVDERHSDLTYRRVPVTFIDPPVGWPLFERWARLTGAYIDEVSWTEDDCLVTVAFPLAGHGSRDRRGPDEWTARLAAWRAALDAEVPHA